MGKRKKTDSNKATLQQRFEQPAGWQWGTMKNDRGADLRYGCLKTHENPVANIIYVEGLSEFAEKTFELARDFNASACNFWVLDRQGQGLSGRKLANKFKQHSTGFSEDIDDLVKLARDVLPKGQPVILLGHSTGGLIALMAQHDHPDTFKATVLTSPLIGFKDPIMRNKEHMFAKLGLPKWLAESYIPGGGAWKPRSHIKSTMKEADFSSDPVRNKVQDYWEHKKPELQTGSPTFGWAVSTAKDIIKTRDPDYLKEIKRPVLVFTNGNDKLVNNQHTIEALKHIPKSEHVHFPTGKHEPLMETDDIRKPLLKKTISFIKKSI